MKATPSTNLNSKIKIKLNMHDNDKAISISITVGFLTFVLCLSQYSIVSTLGWKSFTNRLSMIAAPESEYSISGSTNSNIAGLSSKEEIPSARLPASYNGRNSLFDFNLNRSVPQNYDINKSTQENYGSDSKEFVGPFACAREKLDYDYHGNYLKSRQLFQDEIVGKLLDGATVQDETNGIVCKTPTHPWVVFTAGVMGAGKSHTMKQLSSSGLFPLRSFVIVDPDEIRSHFPEYQLAIDLLPHRAGELTHKEAGYITEITAEVGIREGYNVLVDGSLKDAEWYEEYFKRLREQYPLLRIAILHITAPREAILQRAKNRGKKTGRVIPVETLEISLEQVPKSVKHLASLADFFCEFSNAPNSNSVTIQTKGMTTEAFRDNWAQTCPWPTEKRWGLWSHGSSSTRLLSRM